MFQGQMVKGESNNWSRIQVLGSSKAEMQW